MSVVGITGSTASGKSLCASYMKQQGAFIVDMDQMALHR